MRFLKKFNRIEIYQSSDREPSDTETPYLVLLLCAQAIEAYISGAAEVIGVKF